MMVASAKPRYCTTAKALGGVDTKGRPGYLVETVGPTSFWECLWHCTGSLLRGELTPV